MEAYSADGKLGEAGKIGKSAPLNSNALSVQWEGDLNFPRGDLLLLDTVTKAIAHSATRWGSASNKTICFDPGLSSEVCRTNAERCHLTIALLRARQKFRCAQATHRCKEAAQMGAPSRLKSPPPQTKAPMLGRIGDLGMKEQIENLQGLTDMVHKHFSDLFTDTTDEVIPEWIERRWPRETLDALPVIDGERIGEITVAFRKRTSCAGSRMPTTGTQ